MYVKICSDISMLCIVIVIIIIILNIDYVYNYVYNVFLVNLKFKIFYDGICCRVEDF